MTESVYNYYLIDQANPKTFSLTMEQNGKALHSGKTAEKILLMTGITFKSMILQLEKKQRKLGGEQKVTSVVDS